MVRNISESNRLQFTLHQLLLGVFFVSVAIVFAIVVRGYISIIFFACMLVFAGFIWSTRTHNCARSEAALIASLGLLSVTMVLALVYASTELHLTSVPSDAATATGRVIWIGSIVVAALVPALVGVFGKRTSTFAMLAVGLIFVTASTAFVRNMDEPEMAWLLWSGSSISFLSAKYTTPLIRGQKWMVLPIALLVFGVGMTLIVVITWACLFFE